MNWLITGQQQPPQVSNHRVRYKPIEVGDRFSRLVVVRFVETRRESGTNQLYWYCLCDCGNFKTVRDANLKNGNTQSCGCYHSERSAETGRKTLTRHGEAVNGKETAEYRTWSGMLRRVSPADEKHNKWYADRGIVVCAGWRGSYESFLADMGRKPLPRLTLDRKDNDGNYSCGHCDECLGNNWPANCRWATMSQQQANKRKGLKRNRRKA